MLHSCRKEELFCTKTRQTFAGQLIRRNQILAFSILECRRFIIYLRKLRVTY